MHDTQPRAQRPPLLGGLRRWMFFVSAAVLGVVAIALVSSGLAHRQLQGHQEHGQQEGTALGVAAAPVPDSGGNPRSPGNVFRDCPDCPEMAVIPPGSFQMGSPPAEAGRESDEGPVHTVTVEHPVAVAAHLVTRGEWRNYLRQTGRTASDGYCSSLDPGFGQQDSHPTVCVTWQEAQDYAAWLTHKTARHYRLLTEAEYEYSERAGNPGVYPWSPVGEGGPVGPGAYGVGARTGADTQCQHANAADAASQAADPKPGWTYAACNDGFAFTSPVDHFPPNGFGLFDMDGNAMSWVEDCFHDSYQGAPSDGRAWEEPGCEIRSVRGASWAFGPAGLRSASRNWGRMADDDRGIRVARDLP